MSGLILPGIEAPRVSRRHRLAAKARERREALGHTANVQQRPGIPPAAGCAVGMGPIGPMLVVQLADGNGIPMPMTPDQAVATAVALIKVAGQHEMLKKMQEQQADGQPVPVSPDAEALLAEAIQNAERPVSTTPRALTELADLKGDEGDVDDDPDLATDGYSDTFPVVFADGLPPAAEPDLHELYYEDDLKLHEEAAAARKFNSFDVNGQPCWEEPAAEETV